VSEKRGSIVDGTCVTHVFTAGFLADRNRTAEVRYVNCIWMREVENMTYALIGHRLGCSRKRAEEIYRSAKRKQTRGGI